MKTYKKFLKSLVTLIYADEVTDYSLLEQVILRYAYEEGMVALENDTFIWNGKKKQTTDKDYTALKKDYDELWGKYCDLKAMYDTLKSNTQGYILSFHTIVSCNKAHYEMLLEEKDRAIKNLKQELYNSVFNDMLKQELRDENARLIELLKKEKTDDECS